MRSGVRYATLWLKTSTWEAVKWIMNEEKAVSEKMHYAVKKCAIENEQEILCQSRYEDEALTAFFNQRELDDESWVRTEEGEIRNETETSYEVWAEDLSYKLVLRYTVFLADKVSGTVKYSDSYFDDY